MTRELNRGCLLAQPGGGTNLGDKHKAGIMVNLEGGSPVRRASSKREVAAGRARHELEPIVRRVRDEFLEMPGLQLTPAQASRLWGLEHDTCCAVIDALVTAAFLRWTARGAITKAD